ncbi:MAG: HAD family hydrolase [Ilumatobacteraceae bacterium]
MSPAPRTPALQPIDWESYAAVLFDLDGVLTPTAEVHRRAWAEMFNGFLQRRAEQTGHAEPPFDEDDYLRFVDGKPRFDGVRSFLASRGIVLPDGHIDDPPGDDTVCALGNRKNELFNDVLERDGIEAYPGSIEVLDHLHDLGVPLAVVSSSRNAPGVLAAAGITSRFGAIVDGNVAADRHLAGKPAPDTFLAAAAELGATAERSVVVEDALSGVAAGRAGRFALVIGVDRGAGPDDLRAHGADVVVTDLADTCPQREGPA